MALFQFHPRIRGERMIRPLRGFYALVLVGTEALHTLWESYLANYRQDDLFWMTERKFVEIYTLEQSPLMEAHLTLIPGKGSVYCTARSAHMNYVHMDSVVATAVWMQFDPLDGEIADRWF